jgi:transposase
MPSGALRRILVTASQFTDDALGRVLEDLADHGPALLATLGAPMQAVEHAGPRVLHAGTTAFALFSDYPDATGPSAPVQITYGHSKDHRSDLRQIMMGLTVDDDGQVVGSIMLSGNTSDRQWHPGGFLA